MLVRETHAVQGITLTARPMLGLPWHGNYYELSTEQGLCVTRNHTSFGDLGAHADRWERWDDRILAVGIPALTLPVQELLEHGRDMAEGWQSFRPPLPNPPPPGGRGPENYRLVLGGVKESAACAVEAASRA